MVRTLSRLPTLAGGLILAALALTPGVAAAQQAQAEEQDTSDVASIDALVGALYDVISGPAGETRDWARFRSFFVPGARLIPTGRTQQGREVLRTFTVEEYIQGSGPILEDRGFFEREINRVVERYGNIAHVFSTYESRWLPDADPFDRGINSIQLWWDGERWWIATILWDAESSGTALPGEYRPAR